jgi:hypothetical protein
MRKKLDRFLTAAVLVLAALPAGLAAQKAGPSAARPKRLVRVDLLTPSPADPRPARRDVFSPGSDIGPAPGGVAFPAISPQARPGAPAGALVIPPPSRGTPAGAGAGETAASSPNPNAEAPVFIPSVRYIGYVDFGRKLTALVIADGQPLAVEEKDELLPGYRVASITAERIEIADPSGTKRSYLREGEQP